MKWSRGLVIGVSLVVGFTAVAGVARVADHFRSLRGEIGRVRLLHLSDRLRDRLASLKDKVFITWYVSPRADMPPQLKRIGKDVVQLLEVMRDDSHGKLEFQVVDPTSDPDLRQYATKRKVAPIRVRSVARDSFSQAEVWNTLTIAYTSRKPAVISGIEPAHLPRLQEMIAAQLDQLEAPQKPVFGLAAPVAGFSKFRAWLETKGVVHAVDVDGGAAIPDDVDVLFWLDPQQVDAARIRELKGFLAKGRSVVLAAQRFDCRFDDQAETPTVAFPRRSVDPDALFSPFGLRPADAILLDRRSEPLTLNRPPGPDGQPPKLAAPFRVTCLSLNQDFHSLAKDCGGTILFLAPAPFTLDGAKLLDDGWTAEVLATSSDDSRLTDPFDGAMSVAVVADRPGAPVAKQPLIVRLVSDDPFAGEVIACAASTPFSDDAFDAPMTAHARLTAALTDTLGADARLVLAHTGGGRPPPLAALEPSSRFWWRSFVVFLFPVVLLLARVRSLRPRRSAVRSPGARVPRRAIGVAIVGALAILGVVRIVAAHDVRHDVTSGGTNDLAPETKRLAAQATGANALHVELLFSPDDQLPPELKPWARAARTLAERLADAGAAVTIERVDPADFDGVKKAELERQGITPVKSTSKNEEVLTVRTIWSGIRLTIGGKSEALAFKDAASFENLEFRVAFALWRLLTGKSVHVAFASDLPRLTGAEAFEYYQKQGAIPPAGKDEYSIAREILKGVDFQVTHVDFKKPAIPQDADALVVLQPRRDAAPILGALAEWLYRGGKALLAAQHFDFQSRQFAKELKFEYWPQPQSPDVDSFWFPDLGLDLKRLPFFDQSSLPIRLDSWALKTGRREFTPMELVEPFQVRASAARFAQDSPVLRNLGDQPFLFTSYFDMTSAEDRQKLAASGLTVKPLIWSSDETWTYDWKGGFLHEVERIESPAALKVVAVPVKIGQWVNKGDPIITLAGPDGKADDLRATFAGSVLTIDCAAGDRVEKDQVLATTTGALTGPPESTDAKDPFHRVGKVPLAVDVTGQFPWPKEAFVFLPQTVGPDGQAHPVGEVPQYPTAEPKDQARPGRLVFLGCSEPFKDLWLTQLRPAYRADQLLLNAVGALALEPDLADVLTHRPVTRGFETPSPETRSTWRIAALAFLPALLLLVGGFRALAALGARS